MTSELDRVRIVNLPGIVEAAAGSEGAGMLAWRRDDVMDIAALHPSYGLLSGSGLLGLRSQ
jgi:hypothetical protein